MTTTKESLDNGAPSLDVTFAPKPPDGLPRAVAYTGERASAIAAMIRGYESMDESAAVKLPEETLEEHRQHCLRDAMVSETAGYWDYIESKDLDQLISEVAAMHICSGLTSIQVATSCAAHQMAHDLMPEEYRNKYWELWYQGDIHAGHGHNCEGCYDGHPEP